MALPRSKDLTRSLAPVTLLCALACGVLGGVHRQGPGAGVGTVVCLMRHGYEKISGSELDTAAEIQEAAQERKSVRQGKFQHIP